MNHLEEHLPPTEDLAHRLLDWFDRHQRDLPWRRDRDPYSIWLSEVMLQQTQVKTVIPYYSTFIERYPSVEALAEAPLDHVLAAWTGLGYYRRARQLHAAALEIASRGSFPRRAEDLRSLPGIGDYTAAAIASMAFGEVVAVLDGNVERLLARWLALDEDPKRAKGRRRLRAAATTLLDSERPGDGNQAMMELGATICRPRDPICARCPLLETCRAHRQGNPTDFPPPRKRRAIERHRLVVAVVRRDGELLMFRRSEQEELMPGLWELPNIPGGGGEADDVDDLSRRLATRYGGSWKLGSKQATVRHSITHRSFEVDAWEAEAKGSDAVAEGPAACWVSTTRRRELAMSSLVAKVLKAIAAK